MKLDRMAAQAQLGEPGRPSAAILRLLRALRPLLRLAHRPVLEGVENLPAGPCMLVANHGAGLAIADLLSFAVCWVERFGAERPLAGFAHPFAFRVWPFTWLMRGLGAVPSAYAAGEAALARGVPLLVFPGGDHEACQSVLLGDTVDFAGRTGFVKLALRAKVPIVPVGIRGNHYPAPVLFRSRAVAWLAIFPRLLGIKRFPVTVLGVVGALAMAFALRGLGGWRFLLAFTWLISPFALLPWVPWPIRIRIGRPITPSEELDETRDRVQATVQSLVEEAPLEIGVVGDRQPR